MDILAPTRSVKGPVIALVITATFMVVEIVGGLVTGSLALLADAGHMASDAGALLLALTAIWIARRPATARRSYGYQRAEILAALGNVLALWVIVGYVLTEAYGRFQTRTEVDAGPMLLIAALGLAANGVSAAVLHRSGGDSLNIRGAMLHVLSDALGSVGAITAGALMLVFGWYIADPLISVFISLLILVSSGRLLWQTLHVLLQGTPHGLRLDDLQRSLNEVPGVQEVHDLHAWVLTSEYNVMSAHVCVEEELSHAGEEAMLTTIRQMAREHFDLSHVTVQLEHERDQCPESHLPSP